MPEGSPVPLKFRFPAPPAVLRFHRPGLPADRKLTERLRTYPLFVPLCAGVRFVRGYRQALKTGQKRGIEE